MSHGGPDKLALRRFTRAWIITDWTIVYRHSSVEAFFFSGLKPETNIGRASKDHGDWSTRGPTSCTLK